jgi:hypothetical protein
MYKSYLTRYFIKKGVTKEKRMANRIPIKSVEGIEKSSGGDIKSTNIFIGKTMSKDAMILEENIIRCSVLHSLHLIGLYAISSDL